MLGWTRPSVVGPLDLNFYVYVINLLGTDNPTDAFFRTGDPADDGWFSTPGWTCMMPSPTGRNMWISTSTAPGPELRQLRSAAPDPLRLETGLLINEEVFTHG